VHSTILLTRGESAAVAAVEVDLGAADLLVRLEGNVAANHVVEEDAQAPDGGRVAVIATQHDPLRRCVDAST